MKVDTRIGRAKKVIAKACEKAEVELASAESRSTGSRRAFKLKAEAADRALEILSERAPK